MGIGTRAIEKGLRKHPRAHKVYLTLLSLGGALFGYVMFGAIVYGTINHLENFSIFSLIPMIIMLGIGIFFTILLIGVLKGTTPAQKVAEKERNKEAAK